VLSIKDLICSINTELTSKMEIEAMQPWYWRNSSKRENYETRFGEVADNKKNCCIDNYSNYKFVDQYL
jgi:hypothetical protein